MAFYKEWAGQFKGYNRNIKLAFMANTLTQIGFGIFMVIYNFYIRELGYSESVNGQIISMTALATALILVPAGIASDRIGRKRAMLFGAVATGVAMLFRSMVEMQELLILFAFFTGLTTAFLQVSGIPWLAENSKADQRVHLFSIHFAIMTGANVIGNLSGGIFTDVFSLFVDQLTSIRITLLIASVFFIAGLVPILRFAEAPKDKNDVRGIKGFSFKNLSANNEGVKIIAMFAFAQLLIGIGAGLVIPYLNLYFADRFEASNSAIGIIISLGQAATAFAMIIGPVVVRKVGEVRAVVILQLMSLPFLLLTAYTENLWLAAIGFLFRQALMNAGNPIQMSLMMSRVNDSMKGLANSVNQMVFNLGWAVMGPISTGIVMRYGDYWGYALVFSITASLYLIGSLYFFFVFKNYKKTKTASPSVKTV
ncbi:MULTISPECIES: MFS transporter [Cytobacillus]|uniref:Multidrug transporter n=2 Tax=Cytobacillus oceanisediminis TaxID=665099 RepID=A0A169FYX3_9BACI|nr:MULTISPECIES: MFS transporter [Cytobacillus]AND42065.1 multidrug transporter [Cytobacillus oceanisediminis 2691]MBU8730935.1 MFS transporter [Cytobacillus oceanisediminis]MCM3244395.1 MFS transporter [Cytobacillus oceanisediminis]MCM3402028.1 MFS transporter [Cytobacillus oceanisediminis]MDK7667009.1 MFS transporter [Cytobacillus oceanisediminis]